MGNQEKTLLIKIDMNWFSKKIKGVNFDKITHNGNGLITEKVFRYEQKIGQFINNYQFKIGFNPLNISKRFNRN